MPNTITVTNVFVANTKAKASEVNTNLNDIISGLSDYTKDIAIASPFFRSEDSITSDRTILSTETYSSFNFNCYPPDTLTSLTVTLPTASASEGRLIHIRNFGNDAQTYNRANVLPISTEQIDNLATGSGYGTQKNGESILLLCSDGRWNSVSMNSPATSLRKGLITTYDQTLTGEKINVEDFWACYANTSGTDVIHTQTGFKFYGGDTVGSYAALLPFQGDNVNDIGISCHVSVAGTLTKSWTIDPNTGDIVFSTATYTTSGVGSGSDGKSIDQANGIMYSGRSSTASREHCRFYNPNGDVGSIDTSGTATQYNTSSDYRLKDGIKKVKNALSKLMKLKPSSFFFKKDKDKTEIDGFIAHELQEVLPYAVTGKKDAVDENGEIVAQKVDYSKVVTLLTAALQEAVEKIETLENRIDLIEKK